MPLKNKKLQKKKSKGEKRNKRNKKSPKNDTKIFKYFFSSDFLIKEHKNKTEIIESFFNPRCSNNLIKTVFFMTIFEIRVFHKAWTCINTLK